MRFIILELIISNIKPSIWSVELYPLKFSLGKILSMGVVAFEFFYIQVVQLHNHKYESIKMSKI
jgi:hypothetical protein